MQLGWQSFASRWWLLMLVEKRVFWGVKLILLQRLFSSFNITHCCGTFWYFSLFLVSLLLETCERCSFRVSFDCQCHITVRHFLLLACSLCALDSNACRCESCFFMVWPFLCVSHRIKCTNCTVMTESFRTVGHLRRHIVSYFCFKIVNNYTTSSSLNYPCTTCIRRKNIVCLRAYISCKKFSKLLILGLK